MSKVVLDVASVIWDENIPNTYYPLAEQVTIFIRKFRECNNLKFLISNNLRKLLLSSFPYKTLKPYWDFRKIILEFIGRQETINFGIYNEKIKINPKICRSYFDNSIKDEIENLVSEMHHINDICIFCTFESIWSKEEELTTNNQGEKNHNIIIQKVNYSIKDYYEKNIKRKFVHNSKHNKSKGCYMMNGVPVYPLSCYDEKKKNTDIPQNLLDNALESHREFYNYDSQNGTFVCFKKTRGNIYHGHDEIINNVPDEIRRYFHK